jgi:hypothetical protein
MGKSRKMSRKNAKRVRTTWEINIDTKFRDYGKLCHRTSHERARKECDVPSLYRWWLSAVGRNTQIYHSLVRTPC